MHEKFGEDWTCSSEDMIVDRQTHTQTHTDTAITIIRSPIDGGVHTHTHTHLTALCPGLPGRAGNKKVKPIWILLKQETMSGSGISWAICKSETDNHASTPPRGQSNNVIMIQYWQFEN